MSNTHLIQTVAPTDTMVTLAELKSHLAIEDATHDTRLTLLLDTARDFIEKETELCFTDQTWEDVRPCFPSGAIKLKKTPLISVLLQYYDTDDVLQTFTQYTVAETTHQVHLVANDQWPNTKTRPDALVLTTVCGFSTVPPAAKQLCLMLCGSWNELREGEIAGAITSEVKIGVNRLINTFRRGHIL